MQADALISDPSDCPEPDPRTPARPARGTPVTISTPKRLGALACGDRRGRLHEQRRQRLASTAPSSRRPRRAVGGRQRRRPRPPAAAPPSTACPAASPPPARPPCSPSSTPPGSCTSRHAPDRRINVQGGGSGTGLTQVAPGAVNIGNSDVTAEEKLKPDQSSTLVNHIVLKQGWVMVVNASVTGITNLTTQQASDIWTGKITNWKDVRRPRPGHRPDPPTGELRDAVRLQEGRARRQG